MSLSIRKICVGAAALLPLVLAFEAAWAQPAPAAPRPAAAKPAAPAAKPAAPAAKPATAAAKGDGTLSLGGGGAQAGTGARKPILTRDELRVCLNQEADIRTRIDKNDAARAPLMSEKDDVLKVQEGLRGELNELQARHKEAVEALNAKFAAHGQRVEKFNEDVKAFNATGRSGPSVEARRKQLNDEQVAINAAGPALNAERTTLTERLQAEAKAFNDKKAQIDTRIADWNGRNSAWIDTNNKLDAERKVWVENCSDRRYREEDEIAIKAGR
jgi:chromosome segregation ATPase